MGAYGSRGFRARDGKGDGVDGRQPGQQLRNHISDSRQEAESTMGTEHNLCKLKHAPPPVT